MMIVMNKMISIMKIIWLGLHLG